MTQRVSILSIVLPVLSVLAVISCARTEIGPVNSPDIEDVDLSLALSVSRLHQTQTKVSSGVITEIAEEPEFRGMEDIMMVPFRCTGTVSGADRALHPAFMVPSIGASKDDYAVSGGVYHSGLIRNNNSHLYQRVDLPEFTSSVLIYGKSPSEGSGVESKHIYGSMVEDGFSRSETQPSAEGYRFSPDQIYPDNGTPGAATVLLYILNSIVFGADACVIPAYFEDAHGEPVSKNQSINWSFDSADEFLNNLYHYMSNDGLLLSGAGKSVEARIAKLYTSLKGYTSADNNPCSYEQGGVHYPLLRLADGEPLRYSDLYNGLRDKLIERIEALDDYIDLATSPIDFKSEDLRNYPGNLGLPDGSAVIRWTPTGYIRPSDDGLDGIAPAHRFCYPPRLYYFVNTTIKTSTKENLSGYYNSSTVKWNSILGNYTDGAVVTTATKSVAIVSPLHYAVGLLNASVKATSQALADNDGINGTYVYARDNNIKVTGVIIASQYKQFFDFTADNTGKEYYLYDNQIQNAWLTTSSSTASFSCLSFQTPKDEDVYFCLELENNTGSDFYGAEGRILDGQKFYLVGELILPASRAVDYAFMQYHKTTASFEIHSLENAYTSIPDLKNPQLYMGVRAQVNWIESTPTTVVLD